MKVAQFEDSEGYCIGLHHNGRWINYTDAEAAYTSVTQKVVVEPTTTILQIVEDGRFDPSEFKRVLNFLKKHTLEAQYLIGKDAVLKAPQYVGVPTVVLGPGDIAQAHTDSEYVEVQQLHQAVRIIERLLTT